jgi:hypothetical protein
MAAYPKKFHLLLQVTSIAGFVSLVFKDPFLDISPVTIATNPK